MTRYVFPFRYGIRYFRCVSRFRIVSVLSERSRFRAVDIDLRAPRADLIGYTHVEFALPRRPTMADGETLGARPPESCERVKASVVKSSAYPTRMKSVGRDFIARERNGTEMTECFHEIIRRRPVRLFRTPREIPPSRSDRFNCALCRFPPLPSTPPRSRLGRFPSRRSFFSPRSRDEEVGKSKFPREPRRFDRFRPPT